MKDWKIGEKHVRNLFKIRDQEFSMAGHRAEKL